MSNPHEVNLGFGAAPIAREGGWAGDRYGIPEPKQGEMIEVSVFPTSLYEYWIPEGMSVKDVKELDKLVKMFILSKGYPKDWKEQKKQIPYAGKL